MREAQARGLTLTVDQNRELRMLQDLVRVWPETPSQGTVLARQCVKLGLASGPCTTPVAVKALFREHLQGVLLRVQALMASGTAKQYHAAGSAASLMSAQPSLAAVLLLHPKRAAKLQKATTLLASADDLRRYVKDAVRPLLPHLGPAARTTLGLFLSSVETLGFSPWGGADARSGFLGRRQQARAALLLQAGIAFLVDGEKGNFLICPIDGTTMIEELVIAQTRDTVSQLVEWRQKFDPDPHRLNLRSLTRIMQQVTKGAKSRVCPQKGHHTHKFVMCPDFRTALAALVSASPTPAGGW